jgi:uncharacterized damage-inducible protein DinB
MIEYLKQIITGQFEASLYIYNIRHVQHHTGQLSAYLRRFDATLSDSKALPWIGTGGR